MRPNATCPTCGAAVVIVSTADVLYMINAAPARKGSVWLTGKRLPSGVPIAEQGPPVPASVPLRYRTHTCARPVR